jgi:thiamine-phosphate pyrophosphorylase
MDERMNAAVEAVEAMYRDRDFRRAEPVVSRDLVVDWSNSIGPHRGVYRGLDEARRFLESFSDAFAEIEWRASDLYALGNRLALAGNVSARGIGSGASSTGRGGQAWTFADGRITMIKLFQSRDDAVRWVRRERLREARLYFVCEARPAGGDPGLLLDAALRGGGDIVQLRDPGLGDDELVAAAAPFREAARDHGALFVVNDRPDLVDACGADGVHVGQDDAPVAEARRIAGPAALVGLSTHSAAQVDAAEAADADARPDQISVGPVWETPTKPGRPAAGLGLLGHASRHATIPWFAIGGIDLENVSDVVTSGAERLVVVRAIRDADDPESAARALRDALASEARPAKNPIAPGRETEEAIGSDAR